MTNFAILDVAHELLPWLARNNYTYRSGWFYRPNGTRLVINRDLPDILRQALPGDPRVDEILAVAGRLNRVHVFLRTLT